MSNPVTAAIVSSEKYLLGTRITLVVDIPEISLAYAMNHRSVGHATIEAIIAAFERWSKEKSGG